MSHNSGPILFPPEVEHYVNSITAYEVKDVGSECWLNQHECIEKLNMQAVQSATSNEHEFVHEFIVSYEKVATLIRQLISIEIWKSNVFTIMKEQNFDPPNTFYLNTVLHHELTLCNLLETILYHEDTCESANDSIIDLVDYCNRAMDASITKFLTGGDENHSDNPTIENCKLGDITAHEERIKFDVFIKSISIMRYILEHSNSLPMSVPRRLTKVHDLPMKLTTILQMRMWTRRIEGDEEMYDGGAWRKMLPEEQVVINKVDGQIWISLIYILLNPDIMKHYEINNYRKGNLLKLQPFLNTVCIQQIPVLESLKVFLHQLSITEPPPPKPSLILEQVAYIYDAMMERNCDKWEAIANEQMDKLSKLGKEAVVNQAKRLAAVYSPENLENLVPSSPKCAVCGNDAQKRCSRCRNEWYCQRKCQVHHWSKHKMACDLMK